MEKTTEDLRNELIDEIGEKAERFGLPRIAGQLQGLLYFTNRALSLDEMSVMLEVSKASVSTNIRLLERWKVVRRVYQRGDRKNFYEIRGNIWEIESEFVSTIMKDELKRFKSRMARNSQELAMIHPESEEEKSDVEFLKGRFFEMEEYIDAVDHILSVLTQKGKITPAIIKKIKIA